MENVALIDVSLEDDLLIADDYTFSDLTNSENHDPQKVNFILEFANSCEGWNPGKISKQLEQAPEFSESPGLKQAKSGRVNMRKSLAWDSEFFTSEGVLNTEELAIVNSTFWKAEGCTLPGIQEDLRKSSESTSTLDSESYALENHEVDLFGNLRASIQMSLGKCDKASMGVPDASRLDSVKKVDLSTKMKPPVKLRRDVMNKQQLQCTSKKNIIGVKATAKGVVDKKPLSRPPRIVPKTSTVPSCKPAPVSMLLKDHSKKVPSGLGVNHQSVMGFNKTPGGFCISTSRENSSATPTHGSGPGTVVFCSSYASSVNSSSHNSAGKSPLETARKRSTSRNSEHSSSPSTTKTPLRTSKIRSAPSNAKPTLGFSSRGVSSHSSTNSMVSESSSSASYNTRLTYSVESLDASPTSSHSSAFPSRSQHMSKASLGNRAVLEPSTRDHSRSITGSKCVKSTGLRMPTPKIGYFDAAEKTLVCSSSKSPQASLRTSLVKSATGASKTAGANKPKYSKIFPIKSAAQHEASNTAGANKLKSSKISHIKSPKTC